MYEKIESIVNGLTAVEKDDLYRYLWVDYVKKDVISYCEDNDIAYTDEDFPDRVANRYVYDGEYECNLSYWDNIRNLISEEGY